MTLLQKLRKTTSALSRLATACLLLVLLPLAAQAQSGVYLRSQSGDFVGGGLDQLILSPPGTMSISASASSMGIMFTSAGPGTGSSWHFGITTAGGAPLAVGTYENATQLAGGPNPEMDFDEESRGCNTLTGRFVVRELVRGAGTTINQLAVDFEQHCGGGSAVLFGEIRYNSSIGFTGSPINVTANLVPQGSGGIFVPNFGNCFTACNQTFVAGSAVTLTESPLGGVFTGWSGVTCAGGNTSTACQFVMPASATTITATFSATLTLQEISFPSLNGIYTLGGAALPLSAHASSNLPVSYASLTPGVCSVSGASVNLLAAGTCTIRASQAGNAAYAPASPVDISFLIGASPTAQDGFYLQGTYGDNFAHGISRLMFSPPLNLSIGNGLNGSLQISGGSTPTADSFGLAVNAGGGAPIAVGTYANTTRFPFNGSGPGLDFTWNGVGCNMSTGRFSILELARDVNGAVSKLAIDFQQYCDGSPYPAFGQLRYHSSIGFYNSPSVATLTITSSGAGDIDAQEVCVIPCTFNVLVGTPITLTARPPVNVVESIAWSGIACAAGNANASCLFTMTGPLTVNVAFGGPPQLSQTIQPPSLQASYPLSVGTVSLFASASSGLPVSFASQTPTTCSVSGASVTLLASGTCTIRTLQPGNAGYSAASVDRSFLITGGPGAGNFTAITSNASSVPVGVSVTFTATVSTSAPLVGGSISFAQDGIAVSRCANLPLAASRAQCSMTFSVAGTYLITAGFSGDGTNPASSGSATIAVSSGGLNPPQNLSCSVRKGQAICTFLPPLDNGAGATTGYTVTCSPTAGAVVIVSGQSSPITVVNLSNGVSYSCVAMASNALGISGRSNAVVLVSAGSTSQGHGIDSNGDGKAEVVVRGTGGNSFSASLDNQNRLVFAPSPDPGSGWIVLGAGDFSGSGRSDLLMQEISSGMVKVWRGFQGPPDGEFFLRVVKPGWVVAAITDIDGDGKADIVWRYVGSPLNPPANPDDVGVVFIWFMNGTQIDEIRARGGAPLSWNFIGANDLHGDGRGDLVWVSPAGAIRSITALANRAYLNESIGTLPPGFALVRVSDFDGDGKADLLFRNTAGNVKLWLMNGLTPLSEQNLPDTDPGWSLYAIGDLNGDGSVDIVWKRADGTLTVWLMNKATPSLPTILDNAGTAPAGAVAIGN